MANETLLCLYVGAVRVQAMLLPAHGPAAVLLDEAFAGTDSLPGADSPVVLRLDGVFTRLAATDGVRGTRWRILLSDRWLASAAMPWNASQYAVGGARAGAVTYLRAAGHEVPVDDTVRFDDAPWRAPRLVLAYPSALISELAAGSRLAGCELESVLSIAALAATAAPPSGAFASAVSAVIEPAPGASQHGAGLHCVFLQWSANGARLEEVAARPLAAQHADRATAIAAIVRRLLWNVADAKGKAPQIEVIDLSTEAVGGALPPLLEWWQARLGATRGRRGLALDAIAQVPAWTRKQVVVAAALALLCVVAALGLASDYSELRRVGGSARLLPAAATTQSPSREELKKVMSTNGAVAELNVPLPLLMRALQPPKDIRVALLGLELGAAGAANSRPTLKVTAEAPSSQDMTMYVAFLGYRQPFSKAYLIKHEMAGGPESAASYRFVVEVEWKE